MKKLYIFIIIAIIIILPVAWYLASPLFINMVVDEDLPGVEIAMEHHEATQLYSGKFKDADAVHKSSGLARVLEIDNKIYLRFEDFSSTNVPDANVYLSKDLTDNDFIDIGELKGNIGDQNYELQENINLEEYNQVLIWCVPFKVLVGSAELI